MTAPTKQQNNMIFSGICQIEFANFAMKAQSNNIFVVLLFYAP